MTEILVREANGQTHSSQIPIYSGKIKTNDGTGNALYDQRIAHIIERSGTAGH